ncbi:hypothetical protein ACFVYF_23195 [Streptomyces sp. NPDC058274]|uniref:hypothetical protein n=1 Tax=Streptomyces sp. NPDC058274 TaxID=3346416 RepID=UPI0036E6B965
MMRGTKSRTLFSVLAVVLLALQLFGPDEAFASVHTNEVISCGEAEHPQKIAPPLAARDRSRTEDRVPQPPKGSLLEHDPASAYPVTPLADVHQRASRSSTAHSPAALQVFRC